MRITEGDLRRVIQQVIRESMHDEMSQMSMTSSALEGAIKAFANSEYFFFDMKELHNEGYPAECCEEISSALMQGMGSENLLIDKKQIAYSCVLPVLKDHLFKMYPQVQDVMDDGSTYEKFRMHLQTNADSIAQEMMAKCQEM